MTRPLSVTRSPDARIIEALVEIHGNGGDIIADVTFNKGVMWKGCELQPTYKTDLMPLSDEVIESDFRSLPFPDSSIDVLVFDPPHLPNSVNSSTSHWVTGEHYGLGSDNEYRMGDNISPVFADFCFEARRVLRPQGIVVAKIADFVHNHSYQWSHVDLVNAVRSVDGLTPCDCVIRWPASGGNLKSSKWKRVLHVRNAHSFWFVIRKGRCEARKPAAPTVRTAEDGGQ